MDLPPTPAPSGDGDVGGLSVELPKLGAAPAPAAEAGGLSVELPKIGASPAPATAAGGLSVELPRIGGGGGSTAEPPISPSGHSSPPRTLIDRGADPAAGDLPPTMQRGRRRSSGPRIELESAAIPEIQHVSTQAIQKRVDGLPVAHDGRYDIRDEIARGGMGSILIAEDQSLARTVAMKVALPDDTDEADARARFIREARITGQLEHPNVVPVHDLGVDTFNRPYFTMKLIRGRSLSRKLSALYEDVLDGKGDGAFPLAQRLDVFRKICDAVAFAHSRGVIHRDLKPDNIMVGEFGEVQVMDWGLARLVDDAVPERQPTTPGERPKPESIGPLIGADSVDAGGDDGVARTLDGEILGTPQYMAPEQAAGRIDRISERTDVYALGALLYEMLTLHPPIPRLAVYEIIRRVHDGEITPPRQRVEEDEEFRQAGLRVPAELEAIVLKAMDRRPRGRYESATQLREDIDQYLQGRMVGAATYSVIGTAWKFVQRNRTLVSAAAIVLIGAIGAVIAVLHLQAQARDEAVREHRDNVADAAGTLDRVNGLIETGDYQAALAACDAFGESHAAALAAVGQSEMVRRLEPALVDRAAALPEAAAEARRRVLIRWAHAGLQALPNPREATDADLETARALFERFRGYLAEGGSLADDLAVAPLALWQVRVFADRGDFEQMAAAAADALATQPASEAAGAAFLALADSSLQQSEETGRTDFESVAIQYHLALSTFADRHATLRPLALMGLIRSLAWLQADAPAPFDEKVSAHMMALRCVLQLVNPDGSLRSEVARVLPAEAKRDFAREAADWLFLLRRCTVAGPPVGPGVDLDGDGTIDAFARQGQDPLDGLDLVLPRQPQQPGDSPHTLQTVRTLPALPPMEQLLAGAPDPTQLRLDSWFVLPRDTSAPATGTGLMCVMAIKDRAADRLYLVIADLDTGQVLSGTAMGGAAQMRRAVVTDMSGDGRNELILGMKHYVIVMQQRPDGAFVSKFQDGDPSSVMLGVSAVQLDDDRPEELLVEWGAWSRLSFEVWDWTGGDTLGGAKKLYGVPSTAVGRTPDGAVILASADVPKTIELPMITDGRPLPEPRTRLYRYENMQLHQIPVEWPMVPGEVTMGSIGAPMQEADRTAFVEHRHREGRGRYHAWCFFEGRLDAPQETRVLRANTGTVRESAPGYARGSAGDCRILRDEDLLVIAGLPLRLDTHETGGPPAVVVARFLLACNEPNRARETALAALARSQPREVRLELHRIHLLALLEAHDYDGLERALAELGEEPDPGLVPAVLAAANALAERAWRAPAALELTKPWIASHRVRSAWRQAFVAANARWESLADALGPTRVDLVGRTVDALIRKEVVHGDLSDYLLISQPGLLEFHRTRRSGPLVSMTNRVIPYPAIEQTVVTDKLFENGVNLSVTRFHPCWGVPVRVGGAPWRCSVELEMPGRGYSSSVAVGLLPFEVYHRLPRGLRFIQTGGANHINQTSYGHWPRITALLGRRIRIDTMGWADGRERVVIFDAVTGDLLAQHEGSDSHSSHTARLMLLGLVGRELSHGEVIIHRMSLAGDVELLPPDHPEVVAALASHPDLLPVSAAVRESMKEHPDTQLIAELLSRPANRLERVRTEGRVSEELSAEIIRHATQTSLEVEWQLAGGNPATFADAVVKGIIARPDTDRLGMFEELAIFAKNRPQTGAGDGTWEVVGEALVRLAAPTDIRGNPQAIADWARANQQIGPEGRAYVFAWLGSNYPDQPGYRVQELQALAELLRLMLEPRPGHDNLMWMNNTTGWRFMARSERLPDGDALRDLRVMRALVVGGLHRYQDALDILQPGDPEPMPGFLLRVEYSRDLAASLQQRNAAEAARSGIRWRPVPPVQAPE